MNVQNNTWEQFYKAKIQLEKNKVITEFLLELSNPKNWACSACGDDVYGCDGNPHNKDTWMGCLDEDKLPMDKAMEILLKLGKK